ncbi:uncharacterized protein PgNI_00816 [Pyricularia grisea]|uniref:Uncharacterized protein n=1 Tax=Pyricularia grisea TaxID=148305 RepID=A0A6P8BJX0_PYRGI|nr:uncharacterized protein PgNI_00816 [Pyricularia grisea]TLD16877.1 hypothetical protein PgNI_00816 [Pyricularia grisea]
MTGVEASLRAFLEVLDKDGKQARDSSPSQTQSRRYKNKRIPRLKTTSLEEMEKETNGARERYAPEPLTEIIILDEKATSPVVSETCRQLRISEDTWSVISELDLGFSGKPIIHSADFVHVYTELKKLQVDAPPDTELKSGLSQLLALIDSEMSGSA